MNNLNFRLIFRVTYILIFIALGFFIYSNARAVFRYNQNNIDIDQFLDNKEYSLAMKRIGGYYYEEPSYVDNELVIFQTISLKENNTLLEKTYSVFVFEFIDISNILVNDKSIDYEKETYVGKLPKYSYFTISNVDIINSIEVYNSSNKKCIGLNNLYLSFDSAFFNDSNEFIKEYNLDPNSKLLNELDINFRNKNDKYKISNFDDLDEKTRKYLIPIMTTYLVLFILILFIDFFGYKLIIKPIRNLIKDKKAKED